MLIHIDTQEDWNPKLPIDGIRHPKNIESLWSTEELAAIGLMVKPAPEPTPAPEPSTDPNDYPLKRYQFMAMVKLLGKTDAIAVAINAIEDPTEQAVAEARYYHTHEYDRADPMFAQLAPIVGLTDAEIDDAWMVAKGF